MLGCFHASVSSVNTQITALFCPLRSKELSSFSRVRVLPCYVASHGLPVKCFRCITPKSFCRTLSSPVQVTVTASTLTHPVHNTDLGLTSPHLEWSHSLHVQVLQCPALFPGLSHRNCDFSLNDDSFLCPCTCPILWLAFSFPPSHVALITDKSEVSSWGATLGPASSPERPICSALPSP